MSEHDQQAALFAMIDLHSERYPALKNVFAIPNAGKRSVRAGMWYKAEGLRPGVPDIFVAVARQDCHGFFLEMKYGRNTLSEEQQQWIWRLGHFGYGVLVCYSWEEAWKAICDYLSICP